MPSFLPRISKEFAALLIQPPRWQEAFFSGMPRSSWDRLGQYQLSHRAGVRVGRVEHGDTAFAGGVEVDLVGADAEAADRDQFLRAVEDLFGQLGAGANADEVRIGDPFLQLVAGKRGLEVLDVGVAGGLQRVHGVLVDTFEKKELDLALVERGLAHLRKPVVPEEVAGKRTARSGSGRRWPAPATRRPEALSAGAYASMFSLFLARLRPELFSGRP